MTTAIVVSTYNGEKYILRQLESLIRQTVQPNSVYISDDCSCDKTVEIVRQFIKGNNLTNWQLTLNEKNEGWKKNFHNLISNVDEDIIFLCDQDDIWQNNKIELMVEQFELNSKMELLACGYEPFYEDRTRHVLKSITRNMRDTGKVTKIPCDEYFMNVLRPGCTFAVKKDFCMELEPFWDEQVAHDAILWRFSTIKQTGYLLDKKLILWRRYESSSSSNHYGKKDGDNELSIRYKNTINRFNAHFCFYEAVQKYMITHRIPFDIRQNIGNNLAFEKKYYDAISQCKLFSTLKIGIANRQYFMSNKTIIADFAMVLYAKLFLKQGKVI